MTCNAAAGLTNTHSSLVLVVFGLSSVLFFSTPNFQLSQPWNVVQKTENGKKFAGSTRSALDLLVDLNSNLEYDFLKNSSSALVIVRGITGGQVYALSKFDIQWHHDHLLVVPLAPDLELDCRERLKVSLHTEHENGPAVDIPKDLFLTTPLSSKHLAAKRWSKYMDDAYKIANHIRHRTYSNTTARCVFLGGDSGRSANASKIVVWLSRSLPEHNGSCWSSDCSTLPDCVQVEKQKAQRTIHSFIPTSMKHLPPRYDRYGDFVTPQIGHNFNRSDKVKILLVGDSIGSSIYAAMAFLLGNTKDWCTTQFREEVLRSYSHIGKDNSSTIAVHSAKIELSFRHQVNNFCVEEKVVNWSRQRLLLSMGLDSSVDFLVLQGGLWDMQDRNEADCIAVFPRVVQALLSGKVALNGIILVSPSPMHAYDQLHSTGYRTNRRLLQLRAVMQDISFQHGMVHFYDMYSAMLAVSNFSTDGRHYPQHILINVAVEVYQKINELLIRPRD